MSRDTNSVLVPALCGLLLGVVASAANGQVAGSGPYPIRPSAVAGGTGGHYTGPGDVVPPGGGTGGGGSGGTCTGLVCGIPPASCGTNCCTVSWTPETDNNCYYCVCDSQAHHVQSFSLTFDDLLQLCINPPAGCVDANGNISVCKDFTEVCDISASISGWLVQGYYSNYSTMPPQGTVPVLACTDGTPMCSSSGTAGCSALGLYCDTNRLSTCLGCTGSHTVTLTFNKTCMLQALQSWQHLLRGFPYSTYKDTWMLNVAATTCDTCSP